MSPAPMSHNSIKVTFISLKATSKVIKWACERQNENLIKRCCFLLFEINQTPI